MKNWSISEWQERRRAALDIGRRAIASLLRTARGRGPVRRWHRWVTHLPVQLQRVRLRSLLVVIFLLFLIVRFGVQPFLAKPTCEAHPFQCGAAGGLVGIAIAAVIGLGAFILLGEQVRREYRRRAKSSPGALFPPGFHPVPLDKEVPTVKQIMETIKPPLSGRNGLHTAWLRTRALLWPQEGTPPQLVVGQAGEGKTTLLAHLTERLAREKYVPVPVSLRGVEDFDTFLDLARQAFSKTIDEHLARDDEGDRIWRWICGSGRLVILADDLQLLPASMRGRLSHAFREAERRSYALVVTSRRDNVGRSLEQWRIPLTRLDAREACEKVRSEAAKDCKRRKTPAPFNRPRLLLVIEVGNLNESRYCMSVLTKLVARGALHVEDAPHSGPAVAVRSWLFDRYVKAFLMGQLAARQYDEADENERAAALKIMQRCAYDLTLSAEDGIVHGAGVGFDSAIQAGLLRRIDNDAAKIEHALLQSYLTARAMTDGHSWRGLVDSHKSTPEARDALLFYAGVQSAHSARDVIDALLKRSCKHDDEQINTAITAADVAIAAGVACQDELIVQALGEVWQTAGALDRLALVDRLARLHSTAAITVLWSNCDDPSYQVSWAAGCALAGEPAPSDQTRPQRANAAMEVLTDRIETTISDGERFAKEVERHAGLIGAQGDGAVRIDDWHPRVRPLKRLGWILPVLAVGADDSRPLAGIDRVLKLFSLMLDERGNGLTVQRGPEASIAQGFKAAARLAAWELQSPPTASVLRQLFVHLQDLHECARFWYSRLVLLHGLADLLILLERNKSLARELEVESSKARKTIKVQAGRNRCAKATSTNKGQHQDGYEHAFVLEAAILCDLALLLVEALPDDRHQDGRAREIRDRFIWDDEGVAVSGAASVLNALAMRLLGDLAVVLNLNEKGPGGEPGDRTREEEDFDLREQFGTNDFLPACLSDLNGRSRITTTDSGCNCPFRRCPYPATAQRAHREVSKRFCRDMRQKVDAGELQAPPWQRRLSGLGYSRFWLQMERKAKYSG
jgi:hypothetical protein